MKKKQSGSGLLSSAWINISPALLWVGRVASVLMVSTLKEPTDAAQAALELIDYSQEGADELITQGEAHGDYQDSGLGYPPGMFDLGLFTPRCECRT